MNISIVIPNYNGKEILKANFSAVIKSLKAYVGAKKEKAEIIYVDDGSTDESVHHLHKVIKEFSDPEIRIKIVTHEKNKGFSSAVNTGVAHAEGEIVVLFNTDVLPKENCIQPLLSHFSDEKVFAVGCIDTSIESGKAVLRGQGIGMWQKGFVLHAAGDLKTDKTFWVSGGSGAFRKSIWDRLTGMNELYNPYYWEDIDLSYRAQKAGYMVLVEKESSVIHEHEKGAIKSQKAHSQVTKISYRNQIQFVWLNITSKRLLALHCIWLPYHILRSLVGDRQLFNGLLLCFKRWKKIQLYRSKMIKNFVESDEVILSRTHT